MRSYYFGLWIVDGVQRRNIQVDGRDRFNSQVDASTNASGPKRPEADAVSEGRRVSPWVLNACIILRRILVFQ